MNQALCEKCLVEGTVTEVGTASGRKHYRCPQCSRAWREKNLAAAALGRLGGLAAAANLSEQERIDRATKAGNASWDKQKKERAG